MNLKKWLSEGKNKLVVFVVVAVLAIIMLLVTLIEQIGGVVDAADYPKGNISKEKCDFILVEPPAYLSQTKLNPVLGIYLALPKDMKVDGNWLVGSYNGVTYVVGSSTDSITELCKGDLFKKAVTGVLGYESDATVRTLDSGYMYGFEATYCDTTYETLVSTKKATHHSICYALSSDEFSNSTERLILYAVSEDIGSLELAEEVLRSISLSVRHQTKEGVADTSLNNGGSDKIKDRGDDKGDAIKPGITYRENPKENPFEEPVYTIDLFWHNRGKGYLNTVFLIEWENIEAEPLELAVRGPEGQMGILNQEYSTAGHYVYEMGITDEGSFRITGTTDVQLTGVSVCAMDMTDYMEFYHYYEVYDELPDYILNRPDEEEVVE